MQAGILKCCDKERSTMPSYIPQRVKRAKQQITVKLFEDQLAMLKSYGRFIDDSRDYIISQALELVFKKDLEFARWLEQRTGDTGSTAEAIGRPCGASPVDRPGAQGEARERRQRQQPVVEMRKESA
jgi:hypothetical protein